jgi:hypothetical protein
MQPASQKYTTVDFWDAVAEVRFKKSCHLFRLYGVGETSARGWIRWRGAELTDADIYEKKRVEEKMAKTVLIIDPDADRRALYQEKRPQYAPVLELTTVGTMEDALAALETAPVDTIVISAADSTTATKTQSATASSKKLAHPPSAISTTPSRFPPTKATWPGSSGVSRSAWKTSRTYSRDRVTRICQSDEEQKPDNAPRNDQHSTPLA